MNLAQGLPPFVAAALLVFSGALSGLWTDRWMPSSALQQAVARMDDLPMTVGDWQGQEDVIDPAHVAEAELAGYVFRHYQRKQDVVSVMLLCGRPGPITRHTPDVCLRGAGFDFTASPARVADAKVPLPGNFWSLKLSKQQAAGATHVRVLWAWNATGTWEAIDNPRLVYSKHRALYKLYFTQELSRPEEPLQGSPLVDFVRDFLPVLDRQLFPTSASASAP